MEYMDQQVAVWYKNALAFYRITGGKEGAFNAELLKYEGPSETKPPTEFRLHKEGRHWSDDDTNQDLLDDLGKAIEIKLFNSDQVSNPRIFGSGRQR